jgi:hypothetical protein
MDDTEKKKKKSKKDDIKWHPAFVVAIQAILINYRDALDYKLEHPLTIDPLRIDILVIKKRPEIVIEKQIAEIFRLENILEYKSPAEPLSVDEFHKALARTHLYKALTKGVEITDLTLSLVVTTYPREVFRHLRDTLGYKVEKKHTGIHVVTGAMIPIQIIEVRKLVKDENHWLRNLTRELSEPEQDIKWLKWLRREYGSMLDIGAYLHVIVKANQQRLKKGGNDMLTAEICETFEELGWTKKWHNEGRLEGRLEGHLDDARAMFAEGDSLEKIARITKIPLKRLKKELQAQ